MRVRAMWLPLWVAEEFLRPRSTSFRGLVLAFWPHPAWKLPSSPWPCCWRLWGKVAWGTDPIKMCPSSECKPTPSPSPEPSGQRHWGNMSRGTIRIDDSGSGSWQALAAVSSGVWGGFYLDAKTQLLIILALPGPLGCLRPSRNSSTAQMGCPLAPLLLGVTDIKALTWPGLAWNPSKDWDRGLDTGLRPPSPGGSGHPSLYRAHTPENFLEKTAFLLHYWPPTCHSRDSLCILHRLYMHTQSQVTFCLSPPQSPQSSECQKISSQSWLSHQGMAFHVPSQYLQLCNEETGHIGLLVCTASCLLDLTCLLLQPPGYLRGPALSPHPRSIPCLMAMQLQ